MPATITSRTTSQGKKVVRKIYSPECRNEYLNEKRILQLVCALDVKHTVRIYRFSDELRILETHLIEGHNLFHLPMSRTNHLGQRLALARRIVRAVIRLHNEGMAHLDLKPENMIVTGYDQIYLIDFGLATTQQRMQDRCGTLEYMAPEVLRSEDDEAEFDTRRADKWSLGCVLYELFHFGAQAFAGVAREDVEADILSANTRHWDCHEDVRKAIEPLLSMDPTQRPSLSDVHQQLVNVTHELK